MDPGSAYYDDVGCKTKVLNVYTSLCQQHLSDRRMPPVLLSPVSSRISNSNFWTIAVQADCNSDVATSMSTPACCDVDIYVDITSTRRRQRHVDVKSQFLDNHRLSWPQFKWNGNEKWKNENDSENVTKRKTKKSTSLRIAMSTCRRADKSKRLRVNLLLFVSFSFPCSLFEHKLSKLNWPRLWPDRSRPSAEPSRPAPVLDISN